MTSRRNSRSSSPESGGSEHVAGRGAGHDNNNLVSVLIQGSDDDDEKEERRRNDKSGKDKPRMSPTTQQQPRQNEDGTFARPSGRAKKGYDWDEKRGRWVQRQRQQQQQEEEEEETAAVATEEKPNRQRQKSPSSPNKQQYNNNNKSTKRRTSPTRQSTTAKKRKTESPSCLLLLEQQKKMDDKVHTPPPPKQRRKQSQPQRKEDGTTTTTTTASSYARRPRGRSPDGKVWDPQRGMWIADTATAAAATELPNETTTRTPTRKPSSKETKQQVSIAESPTSRNIQQTMSGDDTKNDTMLPNETTRTPRKPSKATSRSSKQTLNDDTKNDTTTTMDQQELSVGKLVRKLAADASHNDNNEQQEIVETLDELHYLVKESDDAARRFLYNGGCLAALLVMERYYCQSPPLIQMHAMNLLWRSALENETCKQAIRELDGISTITKSLLAYSDEPPSTHGDHPYLYLSGLLGTLSELAEDAKDVTNNLIELIPCVLEIMKTKGTSSESVVTWAAKLLLKMILLKQEESGTDNTKNQVKEEIRKRNGLEITFNVMHKPGDEAWQLMKELVSSGD